MLSFAEKRSLQRIVQDRLVELEGGSLSFQQKRAAQREIEDALNRLTGVAAPSTSLYDDLVSGKFLKETPVKFLAIIKKVLVEIGDNISLIREPVIAYIGAQQDVGAVMESAMGIADPLFCPPPGASSGSVRITPQGGGYGEPRRITIDIDTEFDRPETFRDIIQAIEQAREGETITLKINSHGGRTDTAQAVYVALLETKAKTVARIITAYSSGSIVAMACDEIQTTPHCTMMIHNASTGASGKIGEMQSRASFMENHFREWYGELYAGFLSPAEIDDIFKGQDVWLREGDIHKRIPSWKPIRARRADTLRQAG